MQAVDVAEGLVKAGLPFRRTGGRQGGGSPDRAQFGPRVTSDHFPELRGGGPGRPGGGASPIAGAVRTGNGIGGCWSTFGRGPDQSPSEARPPSTCGWPTAFPVSMRSWSACTRASMKRDFRLADISHAEHRALLARAKELKDQRQKRATIARGLHAQRGWCSRSPRRAPASSFEAAMCQLGGTALALPMAESQIKRGETLEDTARVLSRYVDGLVFRTFGDQGNSKRSPGQRPCRSSTGYRKGPIPFSCSPTS